MCLASFLISLLIAEWILAALVIRKQRNYIYRNLSLFITLLAVNVCTYLVTDFWVVMKRGIGSLGLIERDETAAAEMGVCAVQMHVVVSEEVCCYNDEILPELYGIVVVDSEPD